MLFQALGDVFTPPQVGGTEAQPPCLWSKSQGWPQTESDIVDGPSATGRTASPVLKHFSLGIITFTSLRGFKIKFPL